MQINDLRSTVASKESELETVSEALLSLQDELKLLQSQDTHAVAKDFARRNKQLGFQLEKEKTRARALEEELHNLQQQLGAQAPPAAKKGKEKEEEGDEEDSAEALRQEAAELRNKYAMANKRMLDARAQVAQVSSIWSDQEMNVIRLTCIVFSGSSRSCSIVQSAAARAW